MKHHYLLVLWRNRLFWKLGFVCRYVRLANVPLVRLAKIELKKCAVGKIKNTEGSAMSVGLLIARL